MIRTMKNRFGIIFGAIILSLLFAGCPQKDDDFIELNDTTELVLNIIENGNWEITYFYDTDHEETGNFSGYSFRFYQDGTLVAVNGNTTVTGSWSVLDNSGSSTDDDGNSSDHDNDLLIFFAAPEDFEDLTDDWDIVSISNNQIELIDASGGNGGIDYLTFNKL